MMAIACTYLDRVADAPHGHFSLPLPFSLMLEIGQGRKACESQ